MSEILKDSVLRLRAAGVENPDLNARILVCHALKCDRMDLLAHSARELSESEIAAFEVLILRRAAREPVARILGMREFWGLPFGINEATLEPRPDSETVVEAVVGSRISPTSILDLGTGTGCLLLALLHEVPEAVGLGVDIAPRAVEQAQENAVRLGLGKRAVFQVSDWLAGVTGSFDVIVSNPPYIATREIETLQTEVRDHDPLRALDGGEDGLTPYRHLIPRLPSFLNPGGLVAFEVGQGQADSVAAMLRATGFAEVATHNDLSGIARCVMGISR